MAQSMLSLFEHCGPDLSFRGAVLGVGTTAILSVEDKKDVPCPEGHIRDTMQRQTSYANRYIQVSSKSGIV